MSAWQMLRIATQALALALAVAGPGRFAYAAGKAAMGIKGAPYRVQGSVGVLREVYDDESYDEGQGRGSTAEGISLGGWTLSAGGTYRNYGAELGMRSLTPKEAPGWSRTSVYDVLVTRYFPAFNVLAPVVGVQVIRQSGDKSEEGAPPVFMEGARNLALGARLHFAPFTIKDVGPFVSGRCVYLTSGEARQNYGYDYQGGGGLVYVRKRLNMGLSYMVTKRRYRAVFPSERVDGTLLRVTSASSGSSIALQVWWQ